MKISNSRYAEVLYQITADKKAEVVAETIVNFLEVLHKNHDLGKVEAILKEFQKIWNKENGILEVEVTSARKIDDNIQKIIEQYLVQTTKSKKIILKSKVDAKLLGGVVLRTSERVFNASLRQILTELKKTMLA